MMTAVALLVAVCACGSGHTVTVVPPVLDAALRNPMKGFIPHLKELSYPAKSRPPLDYVTLVRHYIRWDDLEETEADGVEKIRAYCDKAWAGLPERNIKVIPRVILQWSGPKWAKKPGDWWTCWPKDMTAGDWESEQFKDRVSKMVKKLGEAWDDDPRVAWVNMAIMGAWGEHHAPGFTPETERLFGDAFTAAFRNKKVTVRQGNQFRDYCFGIDWCAWGDVVQWNGMSPQYAHWMRELVRVTRRQMFAPFEGEIVYAWPKDRLALGAGVTPDETLTRPDRLSYVQDTVRVLGGSALGWVNRYHPTNQAIRVGASALEKTFGYRYEIDLVRFDSRVGADGRLSVDVRLRNTGSAPFYYRWPVTACLLDPQAREPVWEGDFDTDIRTWLPGEDWDLTNRVYRTPAPEVSFATTFVVPPTVKNGRYVLALSVLDPAGRLPSLRFATRNYFNGGRHPVGFVSVGCREDGGPLPADMRFDDPNADMSLHYRGGNGRVVRCPEAGNEKVSAARVRAERLLRRWGDGLKALQLTVPDRPELKGALACPACGMMHGRICDAAYPLVYLADKTGDRSYLTAAEQAIDWCEANMLLPDGLYRNDRQSYWRSTSAFFTVSLWKALRVGGERLPLQTREKWRRIFLRASRALYDFYEGGFDPNVNYRCIYPLAMHLAWRETGDDRYAAAARRMADEIRERFFNDDGLLVGEGRVKGAWDGKTPRGCQPVDVAYNLEESLAALIEYANLVGDGLLRERAVMSAKAHFAFVLPDGAIDESCSARLHKWTYYGSRTADGILPLLALLERDVPYAGRMAERVLALHERCTGNDGLLRGGLMYDEAGEPPCVHHTFVRMKALADYLREGTFSGSEPFPRERTPQCVRIPSLDAFLVASGLWRATFTANDAYNTADSQSVVSGGTLSLLWHESLGPLAAGTPGKFTYREPHNMQDDRHDMSMRCLAPRLVAEKWSNIFDTAVRTQGAMEGERFSYSAVGDGYEIAYKLSPDGISLSARCVRPGARLVLPIVAEPDERVAIADRTVRIRRRNGTVVVTADTPVTVAPCDRGERIWSPVTGLLCVPLTLPVRDGGVEVRLTVETDERNEG